MKKYKVAVIGLRMGDAWARAAFNNPDTVLALVYDKNYDTGHVFVKGMTIIAFTENAKLEEAGFEEHIKTILNRDAIKGVNVKLYKDLGKYVSRMEQMQNLENEKSREEDIMKNLYAVSL